MSAGNDQVLLGVIQDANLELSTLPFGVVPLYSLEHAAWLASVIATTPPIRERPRLDP